MQQLQELQQTLAQLLGAVERVASGRGSRGSVLVDDPTVIARARSGSGSAGSSSNRGGGSSASKGAGEGLQPPLPEPSHPPPDPPQPPPQEQQSAPQPPPQQEPPQPPQEQRAFMAQLRVGTVLQDAAAALQAAPGLLPGLLQCEGVPAVSEKVRLSAERVQQHDGACCLACCLIVGRIGSRCSRCASSSCTRHAACLMPDSMNSPSLLTVNSAKSLSQEASKPSTCK